MQRYTLTADVEVKFVPAGLVEQEVEYPTLDIEFSYLPGRPAFTPRGEYAPIDPPDPAEVEFLRATLADGKGLLPTQDQINDWARDYLDSDEGYRRACDVAEDARHSMRNVR
jgi:hypothetical protein